MFLDHSILQTKTVCELVLLLEEAHQFLTGRKKNRTERQKLYNKIASVLVQHEIALQDVQFFRNIPHQSVLKIMELPLDKRMKAAKRLQQHYRREK